jgi:TonB family protein
VPSDQPAKPQRIIYGQGEGRQPAPDYPREAAMAHQQGNVIVRFVVGEDGRVQSAQAVVPCPYPLLNQSAVRAVRETWRFRAGPVRNYEVTIVFQLK